VCVNLTRLDLGHNRLRDLRGLEDAVHVTWLSVAHNALTNLDPLARLHRLRSAPRYACGVPT
jgi:Leucine-rich repeat (LRR) protein